MKKFYSVLMAFMAVFMCASAQNLLENGDFEAWTDGSPTNWKSTTTAGSATLSEAEGRAGKGVLVGAVASSNKRIAYKELTLKAGTYTFSFWAKGGQCRPGHAVVTDGAISGNDYKYGDYATLSADEWTQVTHEFTLAETTTVNLVVMNPKSNTNAGYTATGLTMDDASLTTTDGGISDGTEEPDPEPELNVYFSETFADGISSFTLDCGELPEGLEKVWFHDAYNGTGYAKASAYVNGTKYAVDAKLISPVVSLVGCTTATLAFEQAGKYFGTFADEANVLVREEGATEWTEVAIESAHTGNSWTFAPATVDLSAYCGKKIQFAFQYISSESAAGTWEVNKVKVYGDVATGIEQAPSAEAAKAIYTLDGRRVEKAVRGLYIIGGKKVYVK